MSEFLIESVRISILKHSLSQNGWVSVKVIEQRTQIDSAVANSAWHKQKQIAHLIERFRATSFSWLTLTAGCICCLGFWIPQVGYSTTFSYQPIIPFQQCSQLLVFKRQWCLEGRVLTYLYVGSTLLPVWPWVNHLPSLGLGFLSAKWACYITQCLGSLAPLTVETVYLEQAVSITNVFFHKTKASHWTLLSVQVSLFKHILTDV